MHDAQNRNPADVWDLETGETVADALARFRTFGPELTAAAAAATLDADPSATIMSFGYGDDPQSFDAIERSELAEDDADRVWGPFAHWRTDGAEDDRSEGHGPSTSGEHWNDNGTCAACGIPMAPTVPDRLAILYAASDAAERTIAESGGTFDAVTLAPYAPTEGYAVGGLRPAVTIAYPATRDAIATAILALRDAPHAAPFIGTWADDATSTVYVDAVVILPDIASAGILARTLGEDAVWDFGASASIAAEDARPATCANCGALMNVTVRGHHHSEEGRDVTR